MSSLVIEHKGYPKEDIFLLTEQRSSFPRTCGKKQNTVKTEEKHEQQESCEMSAVLNFA